MIDLSGATSTSLYGTTPGTALGGAFTAPTSATGTASYALGATAGGTVTLGADFNGGTTTVYLGGLNATFTGGSSTASFGLLGVYGTGNKATLEGTVASIANTEATFSPANRDFSGLPVVIGAPAALYVRADASNVNMTFNGCQISTDCVAAAAVATAVNRVAYVQSLHFIDQFYFGFADRRDDDEELDFTTGADSDKKKRNGQRKSAAGFGPWGN